MASVEQHTTITTPDPAEWTRIVDLAGSVTEPYVITLDAATMTAHITVSTQATY